MARLFRLYEKKRGDRRTGSSKLGSAGEAIFFVAMLAIGIAGSSVLFVSLVWPEWRANRQFAETTCTVLAKQVESDGDNRYRPRLLVRYEVDGAAHESFTYDAAGQFRWDRAEVEATLDGYEIGQQYPCWYDPIDPARAVLVRGYSGWAYLFLLIPASFIVIAIGGLVYVGLHWGTSTERRAALAQRGARVDLLDDERPHNDVPCLPSAANITNSPGTTLTYRLPAANALSWRLFAAGLACVAWNVVVAAFAVVVVRSFAAGQPDWWLALFVVPFAAGGLWLLYHVGRGVLISTGVGPTRMEVADHPLLAGGKYDLLVIQEGRLSVRRLAVLLTCDEVATYHQGTDTRSETRRVYEREVQAQGAFEVQPGLPFSARCTVEVPCGAMHSFESEHNAIRWQLVVRGEVAGWPDFERAFQLVVYPPRPDQAVPNRRAARASNSLV